jgi:multidrug efflux pump subunit AcrA (membrane-fusion protein)
MNRKYILWITAAIVFVGLVFVYGRSRSGVSTDLYVTVSQGSFEILVAVTGELQARNSENIMGPDLRSGIFRINELRIQDMVDEGTIVQEGDYVAQLDPTNARNAILEMEETIEQSQNRLETALLDSAVQLRGQRDHLLNLKILIEENEIRVEQGTFEPPATQRQFANDLERAIRNLEQAERQYALRVQQLNMTISEIELRLERQVRQLESMRQLMREFTVRAPQPGMVIYRRERNGQKRRTGSSLTPFDNVIATLPDLSSMISRTYVNEIDISKVKVGQEVRVGIDAFPERRYTGRVTSVADIGEQLANTDAKLFEVIIVLDSADPIMRPSMTTSNTIVINTMSDVTYVSIDAIYTMDSIPFVYTSKNTRQVVVLGDANDNEIIIEQGLSPDDKVFVTIPENSANWTIAGEDLIPIIAERALERRLAQQEAERLAAEAMRRPRRGGGQRGENQGGGPRGEGEVMIRQFLGEGGGQRGGGEGGGDPRVFMIRD